MDAQTLADFALAEADNDSQRAAAMLRDAAARLGSGRPGRAHPFLVRILISRGDSAEADTEPEAEIDARPTWMLWGMEAICKAVADTIRDFHAGRGDLAPDAAASTDALLERQASLRVTLSRGGGETWWRVPYTVGAMPWIAAVHVVRGGEP